MKSERRDDGVLWRRQQVTCPSCQAVRVIWLAALVWINNRRERRLFTEDDKYCNPCDRQR